MHNSKQITVLGSTGSIGRQALEVAEHLGYQPVALCARSDTKALEAQIRRYKPEICAVADDSAARDLRVAVADTDVRIVTGADGVDEAASMETGIVLNAIDGLEGLRPTLAAIENRNKLALANKESIVAAGEYIMSRLRVTGGLLLPVDSEHSAIMQCLTAGDRSEVNKIILTASGGPFYGRTRAELEGVTPEKALCHPTWNMGTHISLNSATMMNKGLELIEAAYLFDINPDDIDIIVHRESIVHSAVGFRDGAVIAQMGHPDMRMCIQYALTYPDRTGSLCRPLDLAEAGNLTFRRCDNTAFPLPELARSCVKAGGMAPLVINAANEAASELFLRGKISFNAISDAVAYAVADHKHEVFEISKIDLITERVRRKVGEKYDGNI